MNDYVEVRINLNPCNEDMTDVMAAILADAGFESFVADADGLTAYIKSAEYDAQMSALTDALPFECEKSWNATTIEGQDWNHEWEKNYFKPIVVADQCVIHSSFHTDIPQCRYDIVIDPKMAFGTGHHSTTWLMISRLLQSDITGLNVIDMGTGTGILAILSAMRGAKNITGVEIDEAAWVNSIENVKLNSYPEIKMLLGDAGQLKEIPYKADVFLANINRNVITADIASYAEAMAEGGHIFLSGFYTSDVAIVEEAAKTCGLTMVDVIDPVSYTHLTLPTNVNV